RSGKARRYRAREGDGGGSAAQAHLAELTSRRSAWRGWQASIRWAERAGAAEENERRAERQPARSQRRRLRRCLPPRRPQREISFFCGPVALPARKREEGGLWGRHKALRAQASLSIHPKPAEVPASGIYSQPIQPV